MGYTNTWTFGTQLIKINGIAELFYFRNQFRITEPEPKNSITLINCGTSLQTLGLLEQYQRTVYKHLDFWNPINKNKLNCRTTIQKIKTLEPLEPTKNNE